MGNEAHFYIMRQYFIQQVMRFPKAYSELKCLFYTHYCSEVILF